MGCRKNSSKNCFSSLPQETRKISNKQILHLKELEKEEQKTKLVEGKKSEKNK